MEYRAIHRYADMSARKVRPFAALIRNRPVDEALELLQFLPNKSARLLEAVLRAPSATPRTRAPATSRIWSSSSRASMTGRS